MLIIGPFVNNQWSPNSILYVCWSVGRLYTLWLFSNCVRAELLDEATLRQFNSRPDHFVFNLNCRSYATLFGNVRTRSHNEVRVTVSHLQDSLIGMKIRHRSRNLASALWLAGLSLSISVDIYLPHVDDRTIWAKRRPHLSKRYERLDLRCAASAFASAVAEPVVPALCLARVPCLAQPSPEPTPIVATEVKYPQSPQLLRRKRPDDVPDRTYQCALQLSLLVLGQRSLSPRLSAMGTLRRRHNLRFATFADGNGLPRECYTKITV